MATAKRSKKTARKTTRKKSGAARKRLVPARQKRGLSADEVKLDFEAPEIRPLVDQVREAGGTPIGVYREPLSGHPLLLAVLPLAAVEPTPFQRDLSPTHTRRLAKKIEESAAFLDPLTVVRGAEGGFWTPNGRHRLAAAKLLGMRMITALISPDEKLSFKILALNTEKAHNLKDRSLEVIRMARALAAKRGAQREVDLEAEFESPELLTLGIVYEQDGRFAGGAYGSFLRRVDRFSSRKLAASLREREGWAARLLEIDAQVKKLIEALKRRGFKSPYLRNYVVARINPVRWQRPKKGESAPPMAIGAALTRMAASARSFDLSSVRQGELALVAAVSSGGGE